MSRVRFGRFEIDPDRRRLLEDGHPCRLGGRAFDLLVMLLRHHDRIVSRDEILQDVWPGLKVDPNNLQVQMWALRRLLGPGAIVTVPRRGYRYVGPTPEGSTVARPAPTQVTYAHTMAAPSIRTRLRWRPRLP
jgi:DNA-binding winged helix-turn-helix (wHTH) protein